jgi:general secretion pathway protein M
MMQLSSPMQRLAAVTLLIAAVGLVTFVTVVPFAARLSELREQIEAERVLLGRFAAIAAQGEMAAELDRVGQAAASSGAYLKGDSEALKVASLQTMLTEFAAANRIRFNNTRTLSPRDRNDTRLVGVRVQFNARIEQVRMLLHRIEAARPFLFIEGLQMQPVSAFSQRDPEQAGLLEVRLDVYGVMPGKKV